MPKTHKGMSMIEVLLVVALIATLTMIATTPLLNVRQNYQLTGIANDVVGRLQNARIMAITRNVDYRIKVTDTSTYVLQKGPGFSTAEETYSLDSGFTFNNDDVNKYVQYTSRGSATVSTASAPLTLQIVNSNGRTKQVSAETSGRAYAQ